MKYALKKALFTGVLTALLGGFAQADQCQCPVLKIQDVKELYESGKTYDSYRGYIVYTKRKVTEKARKSIASVTPQSATRSADGSCVCQYIVRDRANLEIDQLGLEKLLL